MAKKNESVTVKLKKLHPDAVLPEKATVGSAGFDLVAIEQAKLPGGGGRAVVSTGIAMELPKGYEAQVRPRSGNAAKHGLTVLNSPGTIDADYRGEVKVILVNFGPFYTVNPGDKIAQIVIQKVPDVEFEVVEELSDTDRGAGGFGSTGK
jgi:dUTP pyrophosphatase